jgi:tetrahydromethanopterin S-methyltransferase subunit F
MIAREGRVQAGLGRQVRSRRDDRLDTGLFVKRFTTASLGFCFAAAAVSLMIFTSR